MIKILLIFLGALFTPQLHAEFLLEHIIESRFQSADKNGDNKLTLAEAEAGMPRVAKNYAKIDTQNHGYVTLEEIKAAAKNALQ